MSSDAATRSRQTQALQAGLDDVLNFANYCQHLTDGAVASLARELTEKANALLDATVRELADPRAPLLDGLHWEDDEPDAPLHASQRQVESVRVALEHRAAIGMAVGVLMERMHLTHAEAFARLCEFSSETNRRLYDTSLRLTQTGTWPPPP